MNHGETVLGGSIEIDTIEYGVPEGGSGSESEFLTNEEWAGFDGGKHWIESGQIAAYREPLKYFWDVYNQYGFSEIYESCCAYAQTWNTYKMQYDNGRLSQHAWDVYINGSYMGFGEGLELEAKELEAGLETTNANNTDRGETAYAENLGTDGLWWGAWEASGSGNYAKPITQNYEGETWSGGCAYNLFSEGHKGDIYFGNKSCDTPAVANIEASPGMPPAVAPNETGTVKSIQQIGGIAKRQSAKAGEGSPSSMTMVAAPRGKALAVALAGAQAAPSTEVATDVVEMHGHFTAQVVPPGREIPTGSVMTVVIDAHTGEVIAQHIGDTLVAMSSLGTPTTL